MSVAAILREKGGEVVEIEPGATLAEAAALLGERGIGAVLVRGGRGARIEGILSERDIVRAVGTRGAAALEAPVAELMTRDVVRCTPADTVERVMRVMTEGRFRHLPVVEDGALRGMISIGDVVRRRIMDVEREAEEVREYVAQGGG